jgi:hypothetical protein
MRRYTDYPQIMDLKRRVDRAGYRTTFIDPILRQRRRLEKDMMRMVLGDVPRSRPPPPRSPPLPRMTDGQPRTRSPSTPALRQTLGMNATPGGVRRQDRLRNRGLPSPPLPRRLNFNGRTNRDVTRPHTIRNGNSTHKINRNTSFIGRNFTELSGLRNIPRAKRVYLNPDVTENGRIKHVYHEDGLVGWISSKARATSPFTRRPVTINDVRRLNTK